VTNRERILRTLTFCGPDRVPYGVGLGFSPWGETLQRWRGESGISDLDVAGYLGFDAGFQGLPVQSGPVPAFEERVMSQDDEFVVRVDYRGILKRDRRDGHSMPEWLEHPVKGADDWRRYKEERLQPRLRERLADVEAFAARCGALDAPVQAGSFPWGVFGTARDLMGAQGVLLGLYDWPDVVRDIMETYTSLWLALWEAADRTVRIDHVHIWEDMCGRQGSLISMAMVEEFMMPQYDRIAQFCRRVGVPLLSVDSDGRVDELVPVMMRHGVNAFLPFEVQAGSDVEEFRRRHPPLAIIGGLDKNALARGRQALHRELDRAERMLALGGYIPGFDHLIPPNAPWESFKYFCEHLKRLVGA
jgi:uroporphyrinogen decarboxylase